MIEAILDDPRFKQALVRGKQTQQEILEAEGGCLDLEQIGTRTKTPTFVIERLGETGFILALPAKNTLVYPSWQLHPETFKLWPDFQLALRDIDSDSPWTKAAFFLGGNIILENQRPIDLLRAGSLQPVLKAARAFGEQEAY